MTIFSNRVTTIYWKKHYNTLSLGRGREEAAAKSELLQQTCIQNKYLL
jgi:hypothetical protein